MKVHQLIEILENLDPDAEVLLSTGRDFPFENTLEGVVSRSDFTDVELDDEDDFDGPLDANPDESVPRGSDVLLLEGEQLRCGAQAAWDAPRS